MPIDRQFELELTAIAHGGEAIGRHEGKVVFVPYAIPGERVRVRLTEEKAKYARAEVVEVLTPSPDRVEAPCPYFGACGGCQWQHVNYRRQLELRLEVVADQVRRLGRVGDPPLEGIVPADDPWAYRNNIQLHPVTGAGSGPEALAQLGFVTADGRSVMPIDRCLIAHELVDEMHASLELAWGGLERLALRAGVNTGEQLALLETVGGEAPELALDVAASFVHMDGRGDLTTLVGSPYLHERLGDRTFRVFAPSFFQVNTAQAENLVEVVVDYCGLEGGERVLDLFCGVGTFSLALASRAGEVIGVESSPWAAADAEANGEDRPNFTILEGNAAEVIEHLEGSFPVVVVDPPRSGCGRELIAALPSLEPRRLVYVSCDPATLARDIVYLAEAGFELERMIAVDMFPQTAHVETVARFRRSA